ncbi:MAG: peptide deformylase [Flavobacteriaceae bacterium]|jgi:peptide deformylase|nr:peptide deformylase [Flavobacteriaceae bacterium]|tara:strand:- start:2987 stop:3574 length:588 start_codon:yes stop_codon:yes gene_type:complete
MILPIVGYGHPVLKTKAKKINKSFESLSNIINNMWETMYNANGVGLAAPQIGLSIRLFIVDTKPFSDDESLNQEESLKLKSFKKVFINPEILDENGEAWDFNEGCLSIPEIRADVKRSETIKIKYYDTNFIEQFEEFDGLIARVIQHEYDHIEGILFTDKISPLKRKLLRRKLLDISKGKVPTDYLMKFSKIKMR